MTTHSLEILTAAEVPVGVDCGLLHLPGCLSLRPCLWTCNGFLDFLFQSDSRAWLVIQDSKMQSLSRGLLNLLLIEGVERLKSRVPLPSSMSTSIVSHLLCMKRKESVPVPWPLRAHTVLSSCTSFLPRHAML